MNTLQLNSKSDVIGAFTSGLCIVHCLVTPFLFVAQAGMVEGAEAHPEWWGILDIIFLVISFAAVWWSGRHTSKRWLRNALWISWVLLAVIILNEKFAWFPMPEYVVYVPAAALVYFHLYNRNIVHTAKKRVLRMKTK